MPAETESSRLLRREVAGGVLRPPFRSFLDAVSILEYAMYECFALLVAILKHRRALLRAAAHTRLIPPTCTRVLQDARCARTHATARRARIERSCARAALCLPVLLADEGLILVGTAPAP